MAKKKQAGSKSARNRRGRKGPTKSVKAVVETALKRTAEKKYVDLTRAISASMTGQILSLCSTVLIGTGSVGNRIGNKIELTSIQARGQIGLADATNKVRMIVFQWAHNANAAFPVITDILDNVAYVGSYPVFAPYAFNNSGSFHVIKDKTYVLDNTSRQTIHWKFKIKASRIPMRKLTYDNISNRPIEGEVFILWISDSGVAPHPNVDYISRAYYIDV